MQLRQIILDITPSFWRPDDYEWVVWPLYTREPHYGQSEVIVTHTIKLLFLRFTAHCRYALTLQEVEKHTVAQKARAARLDVNVEEGHLNEFLVSVTPPPFDAADRRWYLWPLVVYRRAQNGLRPMTRNGKRVWFDDSLVFQCLCFRLRFVARGELSARYIAKHRLLERLPDIGPQQEVA